MDSWGRLSGVDDFTEQQTRNLLRARRLTVRGAAGELHDGQAIVPVQHSREA